MGFWNRGRGWGRRPFRRVWRGRYYNWYHGQPWPPVIYQQPQQLYFPRYQVYHPIYRPGSWLSFVWPTYGGISRDPTWGQNQFPRSNWLAYGYIQPGRGRIPNPHRSYAYSHHALADAAVLDRRVLDY